MPNEYNLDNSPRMRRIIQIVSDMRRGDLNNCRLLDLGCAHGAYTMDFAGRGAHALGLEGRAAWVTQATAWQQEAKVPGAHFELGDARNISVEKYGSFDVILCLGLLYHLDFEDALDLLHAMYNMCTDFVVVDTQIALEPQDVRNSAGQTYSGWVYREHPEDATVEDKAAVLGASLDNEFAFWFTRPSLVNALRDAGFTSVMEVKSPLDNMYLNGEFKLHADVITLIAIKGQPIGHYLGQNAERMTEERWPEAPDDYILERPWTKPKSSPQALPSSVELTIAEPARPSTANRVVRRLRSWLG